MRLADPTRESMFGDRRAEAKERAMWHWKPQEEGKGHS